MTRRTMPRWAVAVAAVAVALAVLAAAVAFGPRLWAFFSDGKAVQAWVDAQGPLAPLAMAGLVTAQIVVAVLPGEPVELAAGYLFGFWEGTAICLAGGLVGTLVATALTRALGMRLVRAFFSAEQLEGVSWLRDSRRFELVMLIVFLIPGTPKGRQDPLDRDLDAGRRVRLERQLGRGRRHPRCDRRARRGGGRGLRRRQAPRDGWVDREHSGIAPRLHLAQTGRMMRIWRARRATHERWSAQGPRRQRASLRPPAPRRPTPERRRRPRHSPSGPPVSRGWPTSW